MIRVRREAFHSECLYLRAVSGWKCSGWEMPLAEAGAIFVYLGVCKKTDICLFRGYRCESLVLHWRADTFVCLCLLGCACVCA